MKKILSKTELLQAMENRVKKYVHGWKTDFYDYDVKDIDKIEDKQFRVWITRNNGTYLINIPSDLFFDGTTFLESVLRSYNPAELHCYFITRDNDRYQLENISVNNLEKWIAAYNYNFA